MLLIRLPTNIEALGIIHDNSRARKKNDVRLYGSSQKSTVMALIV